jgi:hypothetical protein
VISSIFYTIDKPQKPIDSQIFSRKNKKRLKYLAKKTVEDRRRVKIR